MLGLSLPHYRGEECSSDITQNALLSGREEGQMARPCGLVRGGNTRAVLGRSDINPPTESRSGSLWLCYTVSKVNSRAQAGALTFLTRLVD